MKFAILTNTINPHMQPLADEIYNILGNDFKYIYTDNISTERLKLGWENSNIPSYCLKYDTNIDLCKDIILNYDILYFGANPNLFKYIKKRIKNNKIIYYHSERLFKKGLFQFFIPNYTFKYITQRILPSYKSNAYILACSSFVYNDYTFIKACNKRILKFGYFPKFYKYDYNKLVEHKCILNSNNVKIVCAGRFIRWKHFELPIKALSKIVNDYKIRDIHLKIVGDGYYKMHLSKIIKKLNIKNYVDIVPAMSSDKLREQMENADVFILPSDKNEGWGAVLNEAMNSGCACISSDAAGSTKFLINNGVNGLVFKSGNYEDLANKIMLLFDETYRKKVSINAYQTIANMWNPKKAAELLIKFSRNLLNGKSIFNFNGILSYAGY